MSPQRAPIGSFLQEGASEEELQLIWRRIQRQRARKPLAWAPVLLVVALLSTLVFAGIRTGWPVTKPDGALRDQTGRALRLVESSTPRTTTLSDGSRIEVWSGSALEVLENDGDAFVCALRRGRATFEVVPGGPRRWRVEVGSVAVEVVGTLFHVDRRGDSVAVEVHRGAVLIRGENVRDGVQKLQAGERLEVGTARAADPGAGPPLPPPVLPPPVTSSEATAAKGSAAVASGAASAPAPSIDLLTLADRQRRRGDLEGAIQTLKLAVERGSDDTRGAMAAFTLGKLLLDGVGRPGEAQSAFRTCLDRSPPSALAEDALTRLVEAQVRSGAREAALASAREYQRRYPNGRRLSDVRRWTGIH
jgi:transmembrane sensor